LRVSSDNLPDDPDTLKAMLLAGLQGQQSADTKEAVVSQSYRFGKFILSRPGPPD
jgi:hypothetical protein